MAGFLFNGFPWKPSNATSLRTPIANSVRHLSELGAAAASLFFRRSLHGAALTPKNRSSEPSELCSFSMPPLSLRRGPRTLLNGTPPPTMKWVSWPNWANRPGVPLGVKGRLTRVP